MSAGQIVAALNAARRTVCTAESLTAGLVSASICDISGASGCFLGGVNAYQDEVKQAMLGVSPATIAAHTAVSPECAREMALGALKKFGAHYALSTTGYAGPTGEQVGLVFVGLATPEGVSVHRLQFAGSRQGIRKITAQIALYLLQKEIKNHG